MKKAIMLFALLLVACFGCSTLEPIDDKLAGEAGYEEQAQDGKKPTSTYHKKVIKNVTTKDKSTGKEHKEANTKISTKKSSAKQAKCQPCGQLENPIGLQGESVGKLDPIK
jgi:hypothetical protein